MSKTTATSQWGHDATWTLKAGKSNYLKGDAISMQRYAKDVEGFRFRDFHLGFMGLIKYL